MARYEGVSVSVIRRLPRYHRFLYDLLQKDIHRISSRELAELMNLTASQIRQDLNCFGGFGQQGYGYNVDALYEEIGNILGLDRGLKPDAAILCLPKEVVEELGDRLVSYGIRGFWNFSHYDIGLRHRDKGNPIVVENVHLGDSLMTLCYQVNELDED